MHLAVILDTCGLTDRRSSDVQAPVIPTRWRSLCAWLPLWLTALGLSASPARGLTFAISYNLDAVGQAEMSQIQTAVNYVTAEFQSYYSDPITINITVA
jgi:hypothetical protein